MTLTDYYGELQVTTGVYKVPYKGDAQLLANYVLDNLPKDWTEQVNQITNDEDNNFCQTYWAGFDLPQIYKSQLEDSIGFSFISECFLWHYRDAIDNAIHRDNTDYIANFDGYWTVIVPIIDAGTRIDMWADDKKTKIDECEYEIGDIVMLANQTHYHSVENKTIDKMGLHFFVDKRL
jgi:hypothetical protein|tara:strand:+ start:107 stop:640 length:534 start_codon:yes stop_codon:yes gene_type:complete